jgi:hypothetical protein
VKRKDGEKLAFRPDSLEKEKGKRRRGGGKNKGGEL